MIHCREFINEAGSLAKGSDSGSDSTVNATRRRVETNSRSRKWFLKNVGAFTACGKSPRCGRNKGTTLEGVENSRVRIRAHFQTAPQQQENWTGFSRILNLSRTNL
jgi:hypothetical protein